MYYSSGNYEAFARPRKPEGVDHKSGNDVLCFPFDGMSILQVPKKRHKQKMPGDKVLITGREIV